MNTILATIRHGLGGEMVANVFDADLILHINSILAVLKQLGVEVAVTSITEDTTWTEALPTISDIEDAKTYMLLKVRMIFDPPTSSIATESFNRVIDEYEWRVHIESDKSWKEE